MSKTINKSMRSGVDKVMPFSAVDNDGVAVTVTGGSATYEIATSRRATSSLVSLTSGAGDITLTGTTVTVTLVPTDTDNLDGSYYHELEVVDAAGAVLTGFTGTIIVRKNLI